MNFILDFKKDVRRSGITRPENDVRLEYRKVRGEGKKHEVGMIEVTTKSLYTVRVTTETWKYEQMKSL